MDPGLEQPSCNQKFRSLQTAVLFRCVLENTKSAGQGETERTEREGERESMGPSGDSCENMN